MYNNSIRSSNHKKKESEVTVEGDVTLDVVTVQDVKTEQGIVAQELGIYHSPSEARVMIGRYSPSICSWVAG